MRFCIVYDCLFPWTKGGAERWYRVLADELLAAGHQVTYLTRTQWPANDPPDVPGVRVIAVSPRSELYEADGSRRIGPAIAFTIGVVRHLIRHRRSYDIVHACQVPVMVIPAIRLALLGSRIRFGVDWLEVWSGAYWRSYLGPVRGRIASAVQRAAAGATPLAFPISQLTAARLRDLGVRGPIHPIPGLIHENLDQPPTLSMPQRPHLVCIGRQIPDKHTEAIPAAVALARETLPELTATILGDGPTHEAILAEIARLGMQDIVRAPGFAAQPELDEAIRGSTCLLFPSSREGYGLVVVESAARGTPTIVVRGVDNAATELVSEGINGFLAEDRSPQALASAIVAAHRGGPALRESTAAWFLESSQTRSTSASARMIMGVYAADRPRIRQGPRNLARSRRRRSLRR